jgi:hypothetical protein
MKLRGSAQIVVARRISQLERRKHALRNLALFGQQVRRYLASIEALRNLWQFCRSAARRNALAELLAEPIC